MKSWLKPIVCSSLSLMILSLTGGLADAKDKGKMKYRGMDRNNDGIITREEWRGNDRSFDNQDWDNDGVLTGHEVRPGLRRGVELTSSDSFRTLDRNDDGVISPGEWTGTLQDFNRLDQDGNGVLGVAEYRHQGTATDRFVELDDNSDGFISRGEWNNTDRSFNRLDDNNDDRLSRNEFNDRSRIPVAVFSELDVNDDGRITRTEWRSDTATFNHLDTDGNNLLSENEFNGRQTGSLIEQVFQQILGKRD